jgi:cation diffusion facilitator family transporter
MADQRLSKASAGAWVGILGNLALALMKLIVGLISNSRALIADAAHSASDIAGSFIVLIGLKAAHKPPDKDHPYGHGRAESIAAIIVSLLLLYVGLEIAIGSIRTIAGGVTEAPLGIAIAAILISIAVKEAMFQYKYRLGKRLNSQSLIANAWEHRSDVYSSLAALAGVGGAVLGDYIGVPALYYLDPVAGIAVAVLILKMGYRLIRESIHTTMDHVLHEEDSRHLYEAIRSVKGVQAVDDLRARELGHYLIVDVKISVNPRITVLEGHEIARQVKLMLLRRFKNIADVFVHVNPYDPSFPYHPGYDQMDGDRPTILH